MNRSQTAPAGAQLTGKDAPRTLPLVKYVTQLKKPGGPDNDLAALIETLHDYLEIYGKPGIFAG
jgi:hypothetical protein